MYGFAGVMPALSAVLLTFSFQFSVNWKLKVSNTADNPGITQLQARDTRYRRM